MIKSFKINNIATFDVTGVTFSNLKQINFVYGTNGSGKTTISKSLKNSDCSISWEADNPLDIYVYNKSFKDNNILANSFDGVFTLGEKDVETERLIAETKEAIENSLKLKASYQRDLEKKKDELDKLLSTHVDNVWDNSEARNNPLFIPVLKGFRGDKKTFFNKNLLEINNTSEALSLEELETKANSIFNKNPKNLSLINSIPTDLLESTETHSLWFEKIIGKDDVDIADLIKHLGISDWVNTGINTYSRTTILVRFARKILLIASSEKVSKIISIHLTQRKNMS